MASETVLPPSLPQTAVARRNARLRAAAVSTIPLILYTLAAALRLWEPDLVPFGLRQAAAVSEATGRAPLSWPMLYADQTATPWLTIEPLLRQMPAPVMLWVILRGLLDSVGVPLLFLAARPLMGVWGATLVALLYALNPTTWAAARDPAGPLTAVAMAAAMWAGVRLLRRPTPFRGVVLGLLLGLLARGVSPSLLVVPLGAAALAFGRASWKVGGATALALALTAAPALVTLPAVSDIRFDAHISGLMLSWPGWLVYGLAYQLKDGQAVGTTFLPINVLAVVIPLVVILTVNTGVAIWMAWRGSRSLLLPLLWLVLSWIAARPLLTPANDLTLFSSRVAWPDPAATVALLPLVALVLVLPLASAQRWWRWWGMGTSLLVLAVSLGTLGLSMQGIAAVAAGGQAFTVGTVTTLGTVSDYRNPNVHSRAPGLMAAWPQPQPDGSSGVGQYATLRDWTALANATGEVAARVEADEVLVVSVPTASLEVRPLEALLGGRVRVRAVPRVVLPLEREAVYIVTSAPGSMILPLSDLRTPSSTVGVYTTDGKDTGVRLLTVRPRPEADWLARTQLVLSGQFADGSTILAYDLDFDGQRPIRIRTYWQLPTQTGVTPQTASPALHINAALPETCLEVVNDGAPMSAASRRPGELTVVSFSVRVRAGPVSHLCVFDPRTMLTIEIANAAGQVIPWTGDSPRMVIPLRRAEPTGSAPASPPTPAPVTPDPESPAPTP